MEIRRAQSESGGYLVARSSRATTLIGIECQRQHTRNDIVRYRDMLTAVRYLVRAEIQANKTEDQTVADKPLAAIGKILGSTQQLDDNMVRMVYRSLKNTPANPA